MIKLILPLFISTVLFSAFNAEVKKDSVSLLINDQTQNYEAGKIFSLKAGDLVCFVSGEGRVVIKGEKYSKQLSKRSSSCKKLPTGKQDSKNYIATLSNTIKTTFTQAEENVVVGVAIRDLNVTILDEEVDRHLITVGKSTKYFTIVNKKTKNRPITIKILNDKGKIVREDVNTNDINTSFIFPVSVVKDGYMIRVFDGFSELLMESKIVCDF